MGRFGLPTTSAGIIIVGGIAWIVITSLFLIQNYDFGISLLLGLISFFVVVAAGYFARS